MFAMWTLFYFFFFELLAEHGTTEKQSHPSEHLERDVGDVAYHVQGELGQKLLGKTGHDFPFSRVHYMPCFLCDF